MKRIETPAIDAFIKSLNKEIVRRQNHAPNFALVHIEDWRELKKEMRKISPRKDLIKLHEMLIRGVLVRPMRKAVEFI
jgi:hypothetical protein